MVYSKMLFVLFCIVSHSFIFEFVLFYKNKRSSQKTRILYLLKKFKRFLLKFDYFVTSEWTFGQQSHVPCSKGQDFGLKSILCEGHHSSCS